MVQTWGCLSRKGTPKFRHLNSPELWYPPGCWGLLLLLSQPGDAQELQGCPPSLPGSAAQLAQICLHFAFWQGALVPTSWKLSMTVWAWAHLRPPARTLLPQHPYLLMLLFSRESQLQEVTVVVFWVQHPNEPHAEGIEPGSTSQEFLAFCEWPWAALVSKYKLGQPWAPPETGNAKVT